MLYSDFPTALNFWILSLLGYGYWIYEAVLYNNIIYYILFNKFLESGKGHES